MTNALARKAPQMTTARPAQQSTLDLVSKLQQLMPDLGKALPPRTPTAGLGRPRSLKWQVQLQREREDLRPDHYVAHDFRSNSGGLVDRSQLCLECHQPFDHLAHQRALPTADLDQLIDATMQHSDQSLDDLLETGRWSEVEHGDADPRTDNRRARVAQDPIRIAPRTIQTVLEVAPGIYYRVTVREDDEDFGTRDSELDFLSPRRSSRRPQVARCIRCHYGTISHQKCTQCGHDQSVTKTRKVSELPHLLDEFVAFA